MHAPENRFCRQPCACRANRAGGLVGRYGNAPLKRRDVIVALGGDGFMLQTLHDTQNLRRLFTG